MNVFVFEEGPAILASVNVRQVLFTQPSDDYRKLELYLSTGEKVEIKFKNPCTIQYREFNKAWEAACGGEG